MKKLLMVLAIAVTFSFSDFVNAQVVYQIDDGVSENNLGHGLNGDFLWGNYFNELPLGATITDLDVAFGDGAGIPVGTPFMVAIYEDTDNDGNPTTGLMFLNSAAGTVASPGPVGSDTFQTVDIPDTTIAGGFFVAAFMDGTTNPFPGKLDQSTSAQQSYFAEHNTIGGLSLSVSMKKSSCSSSLRRPCSA